MANEEASKEPRTLNEKVMRIARWQHPNMPESYFDELQGWLDEMHTIATMEETFNDE